MEIQKRMCRFCLKTCENFQAVEVSTSDVLDVLQLKLNLAVSEEPVMCTNCVESLVNSFDFKAMCTHNYAVALLDKEENVKLDLHKVYLTKNKNVFDIPADQTVCGFCMGMVKKCSAISVDYENGNIMLEKCLPELDFSIIDTPIICGHCQESLQNCFNFIKDCLIVEEKIQKYCETEGVNSEGLIELTDVHEYTSRNTLRSKEGSNTLEMIEQNKIFSEDEKNTDEVKFIGESLMEVEEPKLSSAQQFVSNNTLICKEDGNKADTEEINYMEQDIKIEPKYENFEGLGVPEFINVNESLIAASELEDKKCLIVEGTEIKKEPNDFDESSIVVSELEDKKYLITKEIEIKKEQNDFESLQGEDSSPLLRVGNQLHSCCGSLPEQCQCKSRLYQTKCEKDVEAEYKSDMHKHVLSRKKRSEIKWYQCDSCNFRTKQKWYLHQHLLIHKDPSEVTMYQCEFCSYKSKHKRYLQGHMVMHKAPSKITMYQCHLCSYETKHKPCLRAHLLKHKDPSELTVHKCGVCSFQTRHKVSLQRHMLIHKRPHERKIYQCDFCSFKTNYKSGLHRHELIHKDQIYQCDLCSFKTDHKSGLHRHMSIHRNPLEVTLYQCGSCSFRTKHKMNLECHMLTHRLSSEITLYMCGSCSFRTKHKENLQTHMLTHKST